MTVPLELGQTEWVKWIAQTYLDAYSTPKYIAELELVPSPYLKLGDTIYLREDTNPGTVVQVTAVDHVANKNTRLTHIRVRQV